MNEPLPRFRRREAQVVAFAVGAAVLLVPANILPVLHTRIGGEVRTDTIFSGIVELWETGLWPIAAIVFIASFLVPLAKLGGLACLVAAARRGPRDPRRLTRLYVFLDFIGRWSMLDIFLAAFLAGLIQFGFLAAVEPRPGLLAFAAAVVLTMLATRAFDPRSLWSRPSP